MSSPATLKSILVVGATGHLGLDLVNALASPSNRPSFNRVAIYHDTSRPTNASKAATLSALSSPPLLLEIVSGHGYSSPEPFVGFDCVIMPLGNHAIKHQPEIIDSAIKAGVRHFYPSEFGADLLVGLNWGQRYYRDKKLTREHLEKKTEEKGLEDLGWTYVCVGRFAEWSILAHFGVDNKNATASIYGTSEGKQSLLGVDDTVAYIVESLKDPLEGKGSKGRRRTYRLHGGSPTWGEIFGLLKKVTGREYQVTYLDVESAQHEEKEAIERGDVEAELAASHKLIQGRQGTLLPAPFDNDRFPSIQPKPLESIFQKAFASPYYRKFYGLE